LSRNAIRGNKIDDRPKYFLLLDFDGVFGLNFEREKIKEMGYWIEDRRKGSKIKKI